MASAKSILEKMITAMNRGGDASKRAILRAKDIDMFAKPTPKKTRATEEKPHSSASIRKFLRTGQSAAPSFFPPRTQMMFTNFDCASASISI
jgi:hypothetical protein